MEHRGHQLPKASEILASSEYALQKKCQMEQCSLRGRFPNHSGLMMILLGIYLLSYFLPLWCLQLLPRKENRQQGFRITVRLEGFLMVPEYHKSFSLDLQY